jgi:hypothetical protein
VASAAAGKPGDDPLDRPRVEQTEHLGLVDRLGEAALAEHIGEVDERPGHGGDRNPVDEAPVLRVDQP